MNYKKALILSLLLFQILLSGCSDSDKKGEDEEVSKDKEEEKISVSLEMVEGVWEGSINVPNQPLPISLKFTKEEGLISIPIQGLSNHPLTNISISDEEITFNMPLPGQKLSFAGKLQDEKMAGTFTQQGQAFPFELTKVNDVAKEEYLEELEVNGEKMIGQIEIPEGEGPFPLMIILAGSGPTDRNGNSLVMVGKNNSLKMIAEELAAEGIASIRYDKRGVGLNMGLVTKEEDLKFNHYIEDAVAWADFAKEDDRFSDVGIIGHSEGSLVGMIAAQEAEATVFVSLAGAGRPIDEILLEQLRKQLPSELLEESEEVVEKLKQGERVEEVSNELHSIFRPSVQPYMISWLQYNPIEQIKKLDARILLINGTADLQVPSSDAELLHQAKDSELLIIEKMNHVLKESPSDETGNMATYTDPSLPLAEGLMDGIIEFIK